MSSDKLVDHLFRHEYGKMVSSLTRLYGVVHLELIEDAVQDSFHKAVLHFRNHPLPENPQAWFRTVVKNRAIDLFRKAGNSRNYEQASGPGFMSMNEVFSDREIEDNQLRLLFAICHPDLPSKDQIIFALKTFSGFSIAEISNALLITKENTKKTLLRSRAKLKDRKITFSVPTGNELDKRLSAVHLALYLLFNEGFHSSSKDQLVRKDLVAEALRLNGLLVDKFNDPNSRALMALMCFHTARLESKLDDAGLLIKLKDQDRSKWNYTFVWKGNIHMEEAVKATSFSRFHWEAAIASEYVTAPSFEETDWSKLENYYLTFLNEFPSSFMSLDLAVIQNQRGFSKKAMDTLCNIDLKDLKGKEHLFYSVLAEIHLVEHNVKEALHALNNSLRYVSNSSERELVKNKIENIVKSN